MKLSHIIQFSGGIGSFAAAERVVAEYGTEATTLLFADTMTEDEDTYRFLYQSAAHLGCKLEIIADGRNVWEIFAYKRFLGNSRVDPCSRILKRELCKNWVESHFNPDNCRLYVGIDWTEAHRMKNVLNWWSPFAVYAPLVADYTYDKEKAIQRLHDAGIARQRLYELGFPHANCFTGETRFITRRGVERLAESPAEVEVLGDRGAWRVAHIKSFGYQEIWEVTLQRYGKKKKIRTTRDHGWFVRKGRDSEERLVTEELLPGQHLVGYYGARPSISLSPVGLQHGITFGDGNVERIYGPCRLRLCGEKAELLKHFEGFHLRYEKGDPVVTQLPGFFKEKPTMDWDDAYLYSWLVGYFATDGTVSGGECLLSSADKSNLTRAARIATSLHLAVGKIRKEERVGYGSEPTTLYSLPLVPYTLPDNFFLRSRHRKALSQKRKRPAEWAVVSVTRTGITEEVFCATVPKGGFFTLEDNIKTSNCGGFCVKAGKAHFLHLLEKMPSVFAYHERKEQEFQAFIGKPYTVLRENKVYKDAVAGWGAFEATRDRGSKVYRWTTDTRRWVEIQDPTVEKVVFEDKVRIQSYLSLKELREREAFHRQTEEGQDEWGGCGCFSDIPDEEIEESRGRKNTR